MIGFQAFNDFGTMTVDDQYRNFSLSSTASFTTSLINGVMGVTFPAPESDDIHVVEPPPGIAFAIGRFNMLSGNYGLLSEASATFKVHTFSSAIPPSVLGNSGLEVYGADGQLKYSSNFRVLSILGVLDVPSISSTNPPPSKSETVATLSNRTALFGSVLRATTRGTGGQGAAPVFGDGRYVSAGGTFGVRSMRIARLPIQQPLVLSGARGYLFLVDASRLP